MCRRVCACGPGRGDPKSGGGIVERLTVFFSAGKPLMPFLSVKMIGNLIEIKFPFKRQISAECKFSYIDGNKHSGENPPRTHGDRTLDVEINLKSISA
jgi:hypothetical protein